MHIKCSRDKTLDIEKILENYSNKSRKLRRSSLRAEVLAEIADKIHDLRVTSELTQQALADRAGVSQPFIARLENPGADRHPTIDTLVKIAEALDHKVSITFEKLEKKTSVEEIKSSPLLDIAN